jgi:hypothetical protein
MDQYIKKVTLIAPPQTLTLMMRNQKEKEKEKAYVEPI